MSESTGTPHGDEEVFELSVEVPPSVGHDAVSINAYLTQLAHDLKRILECVQDLPDDRREALIMRFALGMDNREIARALGRTDGATKVLLHRAIKQLEELVAKAEGPTG